MVRTITGDAIRTRQPEIDYDSAESQIDRLANAPRDFIGRKVYQYFPHAIPPGKYEGTVATHTFDTDDGHFWRIHWPAIGNNESDASDYQQEEMIEYCIHARRYFDRTRKSYDLILKINLDTKFSS